MLFAFFAVTILMFPAGAVWVWRQSGRRGLALLTVTTAGALVVMALFGASARGGNRLVQTRGYAHTATQALLFTGLTVMLPLIASAMSVWATATRLRPNLVYAIAVATALVGTVVGIIVAIYSL